MPGHGRHRSFVLLLRFSDKSFISLSYTPSRARSHACNSINTERQPRHQRRKGEKELRQERLLFTCRLAASALVKRGQKNIVSHNSILMGLKEDQRDSEDCQRSFYRRCPFPTGCPVSAWRPDPRGSPLLSRCPLPGHRSLWRCPCRSRDEGVVLVWITC